MILLIHSLRLFEEIHDTVKLLQESAEVLDYEVKDALNEQRRSCPLIEILDLHTRALSQLATQTEELENIFKANKAALGKYL